MKEKRVDLHNRTLPPEASPWLRTLSEEERAQIERAWLLAGCIREEEPAPEAVSAAWSRFAASLSETSEAAPVQRSAADRPALPSRTSAVRLRLALPLLVLLAGTAWLLWLRPAAITAPPGTRVAAQLPDGSSVELNSGSSLVYRRGLRGDVRKVELEGEAFFEVEKDERPFVVETFNAEVRVLGTRFTVRARPQEASARTSVVLESGAVRLAAKRAPERAVELAPAQMSYVTESTAVPARPVPISVEALSAWRRGGFMFFDTPLGVVLDEVERRFDTQVKITPRAARQDTISLVLRHAEHAEDVLADLCGYFGCDFRAVKGGYEIVKAEH